MSSSLPQRAATNVHIRLRPLRPSETASAAPCATLASSSQVAYRGNDGVELVFGFDAVHGSNETQASVFATVSDVVESVMLGYNGTIMAYGQTGAGKTHTLIGDLSDHEQQGVVPRAVSQLAKSIAKSGASAVAVRLSVVEIYCERVRDLLGGSGSGNLHVKQDTMRGIYIEGAVELEVETMDQLVEYMQLGLSQRAASATAMNEASSRSHCIVTVTVERLTADGSLQRGKLVMVDLAGSERQDRSKTGGLALLEGAQINKSLSCLANVIGALTEERTRHVPYRDSKLTRVLQDSLGGTARTVLIICCSPAVDSAAETLSSLRFGSRAKGVTNTIQANTRISVAALQQQLTELRLENEQLRTAAAAGMATASPTALPESPQQAARHPANSPAGAAGGTGSIAAGGSNLCRATAPGTNTDLECHLGAVGEGMTTTTSGDADTAGTSLAAGQAAAAKEAGVGAGPSSHAQTTLLPAEVWRQLKLLDAAGVLLSVLSVVLYLAWEGCLGAPLRGVHSSCGAA